MSGPGTQVRGPVHRLPQETRKPVDHELSEATWVKSPFSGGNGGECVEVAKLSGGRVGVRDSKDQAVASAQVVYECLRSVPASRLADRR
ncbi:MULTISPECIES: DUF397 domain-containing protein [unclassified Streptosporangium]|uniref:DUF397 domain-containing protein n=1 Tax=unclassified Streptosporangium TaxID=2632669 RepID=UPI002DDC050B|nr:MULTISPECIES: DUF397 domain-containing protein [unclassified Streptosporangium]